MAMGVTETRLLTMGTAKSACTWATVSTRRAPTRQILSWMRVQVVVRSVAPQSRREAPIGTARISRGSDWIIRSVSWVSSICQVGMGVGDSARTATEVEIPVVGERGRAQMSVHRGAKGKGAGDFGFVVQEL